MIAWNDMKVEDLHKVNLIREIGHPEIIKQEFHDKFGFSLLHNNEYFLTLHNVDGDVVLKKRGKNDLAWTERVMDNLKSLD